MLIDLQVHSTHSDGYFTPKELVKFISKQGIKIAALTDHNTIAGLTEFRQACQKVNIKPINGLELYVKLKHKNFNILWFNFDEKSSELHKIIQETKSRRRAKFKQILTKLNNLGFKINIENVLAKFPDQYIPVNKVIDEIMVSPHNRRIVCKKLETKSPREEAIINEFFYNKTIGRLGNSHINIERLAKIKNKIGGQIIINHPGKIRFLDDKVFAYLKKIGIDGMEVMSPHHSVGAVMHAQNIAEEYNFIMTGGSDFHRCEGLEKSIQYSWQYYKIDSKLLKRVNEVI